MSEINVASSENTIEQKNNNEESLGLVDLSSENAPDYLSGNVRRLEAEKGRQGRKKQQIEEEITFFDDLINDILIPKGLATDKEKNFILLKDNATRSKAFWRSWIEKYGLFAKISGIEPLKSFIYNEFQDHPGAALNGKMGTLPENIFDTDYYLEKMARFAADFQTEWKTPHFYLKKNAAGATIIEEEWNTERNQEAEHIVYEIWDLMDEFTTFAESIIEYYNTIKNELANKTYAPENTDQIYNCIFDSPRAFQDFERKRFQFLKDYARVLFLVKDSWEKRLDRKYDGFTNLSDVEDTLDKLLDKRLVLIESFFV
ncbi:MAG: hypothetical protein M8349_08735 [ANME-2 cluster archaeon]|nr:hypothetical protein [ANME-2 cluster archaeon]